MFDNKNGFSLVEVLVAIVVLSIIVLPIINYFVNSIGIVHQSETMSQAADIANDTMEILKKGELNSDISFNINDSVDNSNLVKYEIYTNANNYKVFADYTIEVDVTNNLYGFSDLTKYSVKIIWDDKNYILDSIVRVGW